jgi:hypothetical protein
LLHFLIMFLCQVLLMRHKENNTGQENTSLINNGTFRQWQLTSIRYLQWIFSRLDHVSKSMPYLIGSSCEVGSSITNPPILQVESTECILLVSAFIHLKVSCSVTDRVITHATGKACCLESNTRTVCSGYCRKEYVGCQTNGETCS